MKVSILQPNYIPWIGYFEIIKNSDIFVFYDDAQYTRRDWRNRNYISLNNEKYLISIPVQNKGNYNKNINEIRFNDTSFKKKHLNIFNHAYSKTKFHRETIKFLNQIYLSNNNNYLSDFNIHLIEEICKYLNITTKFIKSSELKLKTSSNQKLIDICKELNCDEYISGVNALGYIKDELFENNNINLKLIEYKNQLQYNSNNSKFIDKLSIIDLIFNQGVSSYKFIQNLNFISYQEASLLFLKKTK